MRIGFVALCLMVCLLPLRLAAEEVVLARSALVEAAQGTYLAMGLTLPPQDETLPLVGGRGLRSGGQVLRHLAGQQAVNGFEGVLYDNRDRGHSTLPGDLFPRLTRLTYGDPLRKAGADYGLAGKILLPAVVFGNSSTSVTSGPAQRSLPRLAMTSEDGPAQSARLYENNHLYVYPEHRDHDEADRYPANWPYMLISQGSSGSDQPFLAALAMTLAAFPPETFAALRDTRLMAPTLQMILRRSYAPVRSREAYLSGIAHPVVFEGDALRPGRMMGEAAAMRPDTIPPMVRLRVERDGFGEAEGLARLSERLFDTEGAIARIWRNFGWSREMTVSAAETRDPNGRKLTFTWALLQGDPARVWIEPLDPDGSRARIRVAWHDPKTAITRDRSGYHNRRQSRVEIGVFASNGINDSAPAFVTVFFPDHQNRTYATSGAGGMRLVSIDYDAMGRGVYYDPLLFWSAPWTDRAGYDGAGALTGWTRFGHDGNTRTLPPEVGEGVYQIERLQPERPYLIMP
ncbi:hypothetical protein BV509_00475 [Rhodovulum sulfidophilum]|uniref:Uncharacterized protein n=1 Tax=Rhodovulum visakhapatnamense TaxID=364297 RepID=A0ABS1RBD4_9RHOB|nr:hypothetical protein [Rhodovulum visakhapatnamense]MBL3570653.1 hypothetical protein [Rhodovulum visakhapatnamense]MBL3576953.1 hypothetical protein [Rhodovulum visakhapatnamense]OLS42975.1 hypothetical protein BV509_00475 [Rhodovulum sulfidophilum]